MTALSSVFALILPIPVFCLLITNPTTLPPPPTTANLPPPHPTTETISQTNDNPKSPVAALLPDSTTAIVPETNNNNDDDDDGAISTPPPPPPNTVVVTPPYEEDLSRVVQQPTTTLSQIETLKKHQKECIDLINEMETSKEEKDMLIQVQCNSIFQEIPELRSGSFDRIGKNGNGRNGRSNVEFLVGGIKVPDAQTAFSGLAESSSIDVSHDSQRAPPLERK